MKIKSKQPAHNLSKDPRLLEMVRKLNRIMRFGACRRLKKLNQSMASFTKESALPQLLKSLVVQHLNHSHLS